MNLILNDKHLLLDQIIAEDKTYDVVEIPKFDPPYVILEILSRDKNQCRGMHVINLSNKKNVRLVILWIFILRNQIQKYNPTFYICFWM
jgi:hypothetical protein